MTPTPDRHTTPDQPHPPEQHTNPPEQHTNPPEQHADPPLQIVIRAATLDLVDTAGSQDNNTPEARTVELHPDKEYESDPTTNSASTASTAGDSQPLPELSQSEGRRSSSALDYKIDSDGLPIIEDGLKTPKPATLLRKCQIKTSDSKVEGFWTLKLLRHILTRERIRAQLENDAQGPRYKKLRLKETTIDELVDAIHPLQDFYPGSAEDNSHYLRIYALLLLNDKSHEINRFVRKKHSDGCLPFTFHIPNETDAVVVSCDNRPLEDTVYCFKHIDDPFKDLIETKQKSLLTPYFDLDKDNRSIHRDFPKGTVLPWCQRKDRAARALGTDSEISQGGYGFVSKVKIHPTSHGFSRVLQTIQLSDELFALKKLDNSVRYDRHNGESKQKAFENELNNLHRFSGLVHDHLVTLLATFTLDNEYYFLFPCAECALDEYWEHEDYRLPRFDLPTVRWVAKQIAGIMTAVDIIHEPKQTWTHLKTPDQKRYGRHGDIKPDNILWFRSAEDPRGILVVSDMGLTSFNRDSSRSNWPGREMKGGASYRPPECEVTGGKVNRSFDIWTLGCLFLEMTTWLLGGYDLVSDFKEFRTSYYIITRTYKDLFFELRKYPARDGQEGGTVASVKEAVTKWFIRLHAHEKCTQLIHDVLDKVETEMLIVLAEDKRRSLSTPLRAVFQEMYNRCKSDEGYAMSPVPETREFKPTAAVEAELAPDLKNAVEEGEHLGYEMDTYTGPRQPSMRPEDLARMDELRGIVEKGQA